MSTQKITAYIVGNPNSGKSTLFSLLTGLSQQTGNWSGVTVAAKKGYFLINKIQVELVDLPGVNSFFVATRDLATDEAITADYLAEDNEDVIINVIDVNNLRRSLYLTLQLLEMGKKVIVVLNMVDTASEYLTVDLLELETALKCPVVSISAKHNEGILNLCLALEKVVTKHKEEDRASLEAIGGGCFDELISNYSTFLYSKIKEVEAAIEGFTEGVQEKEWAALRVLTEGTQVLEKLGISYKRELVEVVSEVAKEIAEQYGEQMEIAIAYERYKYIDIILENAVTAIGAGLTLDNKVASEKLDKIFLHKFLGIPIFLLIIYIIFTFSIVVGGLFQDFFEILANTFFVEGPAHLLKQDKAPGLVLVLVQGVGVGLATIAPFIPIITASYLIFSFLEESGYLSRAGLLADKLMSKVGLSGRSFILLVLGFGCNVPAIMATRVLESSHQRVATIVMLPFMSCSARLSVFVLFCAAFFPHSGQSIVLLLYVTGIIVGLLTAHIVTRIVGRGVQIESYFLIALPNYQLPTLKIVLLKTYGMLKSFVFGAGKLTIIVCFVLNLLNTFSWQGAIVEPGSPESILVKASQAVTPIFKPIGVSSDNWPATVAIITGLFAKEVVVGTMQSLYAAENLQEQVVKKFSLKAGIQEAYQSVGKNLADFGNKALMKPLLYLGFGLGAGEELLQNDDTSSINVAKVQKAFGSRIQAFAYLLFILLYFPCVSVFAIISHEIGWRWAVFSGIWSTAIAYVIASAFYQSALLLSNLFS